MKTKTLLLFVLFFGFSIQSFANQSTIFIKLKNKNDSLLLNNIASLESISAFSPIKSEYFSSLYQAKIKNFSQLTTYQVTELITELKKLNFIESIENNSFYLPQSIIPADQSELLTNDRHFPLQWGLYNQGQTVIDDITDIEFNFIKGVPGADIGWKNARTLFENKLNKTVTVAVIDSGVTLEHPDLEHAIFRNEKECNPDGNPIPSMREDKDKNGFKGDCMGWNFSAPGVGDNKPYDRKGHGTHIAGIIAAKSNNNFEGASGVYDQIKILPIKIFDKKDDNSDDSDQKIALLTDRIAKAILYAVIQKVQVINLSLGWPKLNDREYLRKAFQAAHDAGIIFVAAAGNNSTNQVSYPCAYKKVICVGSINVDGTVSDFSNYGGSVDFLAPGDRILSTYLTSLSPSFFNQKGYEILSGTSQSTPFVAAMTAILLGTGKASNYFEIKNLFIQSAQKLNHPTFKALYSNDGLINLEKSLLSNLIPLFRPDFKEFETIEFQNKQNTFSFPLIIDAMNAQNQKVQVKVWGMGDAAQIAPLEFHHQVNSEQPISLNIEGVITDSLADHNLNLWVELTYADRKEIFRHEVKLIRKLLDADLENSLAIKFREGFTPKDNFIEDLRTVLDFYAKPSFPDYYIEQKSDDGILLEVFQKNPSLKEIEQLNNPLFLPGALKLINIFYLDANFDGELDYLVYYQGRNILENGAVGPFLQYAFFNRDGSPLFSNYKNAHLWMYLPLNAITDFKNTYFVPHDHPLLGKVAIPYFIFSGTIPSGQDNPSKFALKNQHMVPGLYSLHPEVILNEANEAKVNVKAVLWNDFKLNQTFQKSGDLKFYESITPITLVRTKHHNDLVSVDFLIKFGKKYSILTVQNNGDMALNPFADQSIDFQSKHIQFVRSLSDDAQEFSKDFYLPISESIIYFGQVSADANFQREYVHPDKKDYILNFLGTSEQNGDYFSSFLTKTKFVTHFENAEKSVYLYNDLVRFSFLPGVVLAETFTPIKYYSNKTFLPSYFVDSTSIKTDYLYLLVPSINQNKIISPAHMAIKLPKNCASKHPSRIDDIGTHSYLFACQFAKNNQKYFFIKSIFLTDSN